MPPAGSPPRHGRRVLLITDPMIAATPGFGTVEAALGAAGLEVAVFTGAEVDVPSSAVDAAVELGRATEPDVIVAVGGGSVIDLAKVTALLLAHGGELSDYYAVNSVPGPICRWSRCRPPPAPARRPRRSR